VLLKLEALQDEAIRAALSRLMDALLAFVPGSTRRSRLRRDSSA
jgi:hypothetical protein